MEKLEPFSEHKALNLYGEIKKCFHVVWEGAPISYV